MGAIDDLGGLRLFIRAAELGSFSRAAEERHCKVSTVSRAVALLEAELGAALFNRSTRRLHLTEVGQSLLAEARRLTADFDDTWQALAALNDRPQGLLRLNAPVVFGRRHVLPHLPDFLAAHAEVRVDLTLSDAVVDLIAEGADLAIRIGALPASSLVARKLAAHRRVLCAAPGFLAGAGPLEHPHDLLRVECLPFSLLPSRVWHFARAGESVAVGVAGRVTANNSDALHEAALAGLGVALLPDWLVRPDLDAGRLLPLLAGWEASLQHAGDQAIWAVYAPKKVVAPKVRAFIDYFRATVGSPPSWA